MNAFLELQEIQKAKFKIEEAQDIEDFPEVGAYKVKTDVADYNYNERSLALGLFDGINRPAALWYIGNGPSELIMTKEYE